MTLAAQHAASTWEAAALWPALRAPGWPVGACACGSGKVQPQLLCRVENDFEAYLIQYQRIKSMLGCDRKQMSIGKEKLGHGM